MTKQTDHDSRTASAQILVAISLGARRFGRAVIVIPTGDTQLR